MKNNQNYSQDIAHIRSIMEQSTRFMSLSGWAGIMAGIYALLGIWFANKWLGYEPGGFGFYRWVGIDFKPASLIGLGLAVLILSMGTAIYLSSQKALKEGKKPWNSASRRLLMNTAVPLVAGGITMLAFISQQMYSTLIPLSLIFSGLSLYHGGRDSYKEIRILGIFEIVLGLMSLFLIEYSMFLWALGFGFLHIVYGIYLHYKYER